MTLEELNTLVGTDEFDEFIRVCEARQVKALSKIADDIVAHKSVRLVLVAGASSAGKTTTAKRLATQLRVDDRKALHLSTDDYYLPRNKVPRDENGELDFETIESLDLDRLTQDIDGLLKGEAVHLRKFSFESGKPFNAKAVTSLPPTGCIILEGLHALNPRIAADIPDDVKWRVFVDPVSQPEIVGKITLSPSSARLMRRLVRDCHFRKTSPSTTFHMWPKVCEGEEKWIKPFKDTANSLFDSALAYELAVLKPYVAGLINLVMRREPENFMAQRLDELLSLVRPASSVTVPGDSILRETIGSSQLDY